VKMCLFLRYSLWLNIIFTLFSFKAGHYTPEVCKTDFEIRHGHLDRIFLREGKMNRPIQRATCIL